MQASVTEEVKISGGYDSCNTKDASASTVTGSLEGHEGISGEIPSVAAVARQEMVSRAPRNKLTGRDQGHGQDARASRNDERPGRGGLGR